MTSGSLVAGFWDETAVELARREGLSGPDTARALALVMGATMDANIACHKVKYTHWVPRPSQADPSIRTLIGLPNHPSYPSNHSCDSMAAATVLGRLFPRHHPALEAMAHEAGESRVDGGIHYRFDVEAGEGIGRAAAAAALKAAGATTVAEQRP
jgi:membrane-associated phospholipid phosphatase